MCALRNQAEKGVGVTVTQNVCVRGGGLVEIKVATNSSGKLCQCIRLEDQPCEFSQPSHLSWDTFEVVFLQVQDT